MILAGCFLSVAHIGQAQSTVLDTIVRPGHLDYSRYTVPSLCVQAALSITETAERALVDSAAYAPERDSLPQAAIGAARTCGEKFTASSVEPRELLSLLQLSIIANDDQRADATIERMTSAESDLGARAWRLLSIAETYMDARPGRLADAERIVERLDALGNPAALPRLSAHSMLLQDAKSRFDVARIEREALAILALDPLLSDSVRRDNAEGIGTGNAVQEILTVELYKSFRTAVDETLRLVRQTKFQWPLGEEQSSSALRALVSPIGAPPPPVIPKYWYGPHGQSNWPVEGKVTLLMVAPREASTTAYKQHAMIRRLHEKFGDALQIILITKTHGFFQQSPPLSPDTEADTLRAHLLDVLQLPVTVAVEESTFTRLPDGRRIDSPSTYEQAMLYMYGGVLTDTHGNVAGFGLNDEATLEAYISRLIKKE